MKTNALFAVATCVALMLCAATHTASAKVEVGDTPQFAVVTMDGKAVSPQILRGRITILEFWATWCPPCRAQIPHLKKLHRESQGTNVVLISISTDDRERTARKFVEDNAMTWPQVHDRSQRNPIQGQFGVRGIPHALLLSPEGEVLWRGHPANIAAPLAEAKRRFPANEQNAGEPAVKAHEDKPDAQVTAQQKSEQPENVHADEDRQRLQEAVLALVAAMRERDEQQRERVLDAATAMFAELPLPLLHAYPRDETLLELAEALKEMSPRERFELGASTKRSRSTTQVSTVLRIARAAEAAMPEVAEVPVRGEPGTDGEASGPDARLVAAKTRIAEQAIEQENHLKAYETFQWLAERGHEPSAQRVAAYEADEEAMEAIEEARRDRQAARLFEQARMLASAGHHEKAIELLEQIVETHRQSSYAKLAEVELAQLR